MKKENLIIRANLAFYDSVAAGEPLTSPAQSVAWVNSLADKGVETLFVLTNNDKYYRQPLNAKIGIINKKDFVEQFGEYIDTDFGNEADFQVAETLPEAESEVVADEVVETVAETEKVEVAAEVKTETEQAVAEPQVIVEKEIVEVEVEKIVVQLPDNDTLKQLIKEAIKELIL